MEMVEEKRIMMREREKNLVEHECQVGVGQEIGVIVFQLRTSELLSCKARKHEIINMLLCLYKFLHNSLISLRCELFFSCSSN